MSQILLHMILLKRSFKQADTFICTDLIIASNTCKEEEPADLEMKEQTFNSKMRTNSYIYIKSVLLYTRDEIGTLT